MTNILLFALEITVAELLFSLRMQKRKFFWLRLIGWIVAMAGVSALCALLPDIVFSNAVAVSGLYIGLFVLSVLLMMMCYDEKWINVFFCGICAYTLQHMAYGFANLAITCITRTRSPILDLYADGTNASNMFGRETSIAFLVYALCFYTSYGVCFMLFRKAVDKNRQIKIRSAQVPLLIAMGLLIDIALNMMFVYLVPSDVEVMVNIIFSVYSCAACILFLFVLFGLAKNKKLEDEKNFIEYLSKKQTELYDIRKENMELVNMKAHDMKYQLREIGKNQFMPQETISEIERIIIANDAVIKTGYPVLDMLLTDKSMYCGKNDISFTCLADGAAISFMSDADIYSLFGNALDNAIESCMKMDGKAPRIIGMKLAAVDNFVSVNVYNSFDGEIVIRDGLPQTSKSDSAFHGYGMKSIRYIVEKYSGDLQIQTDGSVFNLNILLPIPK